MTEQEKIKLFQRVEKAIVWSIVALSCAALFISLLVQKDVLFLYIFGKMVLFRIIVDVIVGLWIFLCIYKKSYRPNFRDPIIFLLSVFMLAIGLSLVTSIDPYRSFWSYQERMMGFLTMLHLWAWALALSATLKLWSQWRVLFVATLSASVFVGLYGIGQKFHLPFLFAETDRLRMASTLGNPIYLGAYALLHIFISFFLFFRFKNPLYRTFALAAFAFNIFLLFASATRGVVLASLIAGAGLVVSLLLQIRAHRIQFVLRRLLLCSAIASIGGLIFLYTPFGRDAAEQYLPPFAQKLVYKSLTDPGRLVLWEAGMKGFLARPLTGWGWSTFDYVNNTYITDTHVIRVENPWNDQSHNQVLDVFVMAGVIGGAVYLAFWVFLFESLIRRVRLTTLAYQKRSALLVCVWLFVAYFIQNLTVFDNPAPIIVFYFCIAAVTFLVQERPDVAPVSREYGLDRKQERELHESEQKMPFPVTGYIVLPLLVATSVAGIIILNATHYKTSQRGIRALRSLESGDMAATLSQFKTVFATHSFVVPEFREQLAEAAPNILANPRYTSDQKRDFMKMVVDESKKNLDEHPKNFRYFLRMAGVYRDAQQFEPEANRMIREVSQRALVLYPRRFELYKEIAESYALDRDFTNAIENGKKAVEFDQIKARSLWSLAIIYARSGDIKGSLDAAWDAMMDDCRMTEYKPYFVALADSFPPTLDDRALDFFVTMAVAYGRKDPAFMYAGQKVLIRANQLHEQQAVSSSPVMPHK